MESPKGFPKGLDFLGCLNVTLVLRDFQVLTGRFRGFIGDRGYDDCPCADYDDDKPKKDDEKDKEKDKDKGCKQPKLDIKVDVDEETKFILLELTRPTAAVNLSSFTCTVVGDVVTDIALVVSGTTFPVGTCVAVNVENILYAGPSPEFCDIPITIGTAATGGLTLSLKK